MDILDKLSFAAFEGICDSYAAEVMIEAKREIKYLRGVLARITKSQYNADSKELANEALERDFGTITISKAHYRP
jgi:hypothetical protein